MTPEMRQSVAAFAMIRRQERGQDLWLAQWNPHWQCYNFVGGHKRDGESFRQCVTREVAEELQLVEGHDFIVAQEPTAHLEYSDWSESARKDTAYTVEFFVVQLSGQAALDLIASNTANRWLTTSEIEKGTTRDGQPVSRTMGRLLHGIGAFTGNTGIVEGRMTPKPRDRER